MTRDEIAALFARRRQAWDRLDAAALAADYTEDATYFAAFPDFKFEHEMLLIDGDNIAQLIRASGTDIGGFMGMAPTRRKITFRCGFFYMVRDGQIARERRVYDFTGVLIQVGLLKAKPV